MKRADSPVYKAESKNYTENPRQTDGSEIGGGSSKCKQARSSRLSRMNEVGHGAPEPIARFVFFPFYIF